jgi:PAS domain S-box-containing protein
MRINPPSKAFITAGGVIAAYLIWFVLDPGSQVRFRISAVLLFFLWLYAALKSRSVIQHGRLGEVERSWRYLSVAIWIWAATYAIDGTAVAFFGKPLGSPSVVDLLRLAGYLGALSFAVSYPVSPPGRFGRLRDTLDIVILIIAVLTLDWLIFIRPVFTVGLAQPGEVFWISLNPVFDTILLVLLVRLLLNHSGKPQNTLFKALSLSFFTLFLADLAGSYQVLNHEVIVSPFLGLNIGLCVGFMLFTFSRLQEKVNASSPSHGAIPRGLAYRFERLLPLALTYIVVGFILIDWWLSGTVDWVGIVSAAFLVLLLFARQGVVAGQQEMVQYAALVNATADMAFICDQEGYLILANPALKAAVGIPDGQDGSVNISEFMQVDKGAGYAFMRTTLEGWTGEIEFRSAEGGVFPVLLSINPLSEWRGSELLLAGTAHDLSVIREREDDLRAAVGEIDQARQELAILNSELEDKVRVRTHELQSMVADLERLNEELQALDRLKSEFVALVSHELRAPLTNIRSGVELILNQYPDISGAARTSLTLVQKETGRLTDFVEMILDLSALEAGRFELEIHPIPPADVAAIARDRLQIDQNIERIRLDIPAGIRDMCADEAALGSVVYHLLDNALKYAPQGEIVINAWDEEEHVFMAVQDEGPGIPIEAREMIFDMFHRLDASDAREIYGYGLGLPMAHRLIDAMGGGIYVDEVERGTRMVFWLPAAV